MSGRAHADLMAAGPRLTIRDDYRLDHSKFLPALGGVLRRGNAKQRNGDVR